jgi:hypothetical protein
MKKLLSILCSLAMLSASSAAIPNAQSASGSATGAAVVCNLAGAGTDGFVVILDGQAQATSTITVAIQVLNPMTGNYSTPTTVPGSATANPITLTNATTQTFTIPGGYPGIQVNVTSFGTATGTFRAMIWTY